MINAINGWTKESMISAVTLGNKGFVSLNSNTRQPAYYGSNNNKCTLGVFIPSYAYSTGLEGHSIAQLPELANLMPLPLKALEELQFMHDICGYGIDPRIECVKWIMENVA